MRIEGGCHCGYISYRADVDQDSIGICHCTDCQTFSGSAFRTTAFARRDAFELLSGRPKIYVKIAESGNGRAQAFCPECGTHIYAAAPVDPQVFGIRIGTARQRAELLPTRQIWCRSAQPWVMHLESIGRFDRQPPAA